MFMSPDSTAIPGAAVQLGQEPARFVDEESVLAPLRAQAQAAAAPPSAPPMSNQAKLIWGLLAAGGLYVGWKIWKES